MRIGEIRQFCQLQDEGQSLMRAAMSQLQLSARAYHRILKLARTIADLAGSEEIQSTHLAEALQYRPKLMIYWARSLIAVFIFNAKPPSRKDSRVFPSRLCDLALRIPFGKKRNLFPCSV
jgi:hypothetical protein